MRSRRFVAALLLVVGVVAAPVRGGSPGAHASGPTPGGISVELDRSAVTTTIGHRFEFSSTVRNETGAPLAGVIAHLNILSTDPATYVDPEDWSSHRTRYVDRLPTNASVRVTWQLQAVNSGQFVVYVAVTNKRGVAQVAASDGLRLVVADRRTIDANGILPLALGMPAAVLLLMGLSARRRRRRISR